MCGFQVGSIAKNSYLQVDRTPGKYTVSISGGLLASPSEFDIELTPGQTRYFSIEPQDTIAVAPPLVVPIRYPTLGRTVPPKNSFNTVFRLAEMNASDAVALLATLEAPKSANAGSRKQ